MRETIYFLTLIVTLSHNSRTASLDTVLLNRTKEKETQVPVPLSYAQNLSRLDSAFFVVVVGLRPNAGQGFLIL